MALTQVQSGLLESGAALNNIGAGNITPSYLSTQAQYTGFKNRLINGGMTIFQRGTSIAPTAGGAYTLDRWLTYASSGTSAVTQSTDAPAGFSNSFLWTTTTGGTRNSSDYYEFVQFIEGFNFADMMWGTANAQPITLSFWVKSSVTGTFSVLFRNSIASRSYVTTYSINTANTWEYKTITLTGDITGTWVGATNGKGLEIWWDLGSGSTYQTSSLNTWLNNASTALASTSQAAVGSVTGATFRITGVQLEKGSTATSFDYRPYGTELALCQRYFEKSYNTETAVGANLGSNATSIHAVATVSNSRAWAGNIAFRVTKRATPTITLYDQNGTSGQWYWGQLGVNESTTAVVVQNANFNGIQLMYTSSYPSGTNGTYGHYTASAEL